MNKKNNNLNANIQIKHNLTFKTMQVAIIQNNQAFMLIE